MGGEWPVVSLRDVCRKIGSGATPRGGKESYKQAGIPLIRSQNVHTEGFNDQGLAFIDEEQARQLDNVVVEHGDVLLNITGESVCRVCQAPAYVVPARVNQHVAIIRPRRELLDPTFLRYYLATPSMQSHMHALAGGGATRRALTKKMIDGFEIPCPPLPEQRAIAHILGSLDDKIELNRKMNRTLEEMARALFKSWFVDFDPVRAKAEGRQPPGMDAETAALFPDGFEDSELGPIPRGWESAAIGDVVSVKGGSTPSTRNPDYWDGGTIHWTTPKDLSSLKSPVLLDTARKITAAGLAKISSGLLPAGTLLLSSRAPVGYLAISQVPIAVNQGYIAMPPGGRVSSLWMLYWLQANMDRILARAGGTTFAEISKRNFRPISLVVPSSGLLERFDEVVGPLFQRVVANELESRTLAALRDTLLPKLVSGEIRVPDAEKLLEDAP